MSEVKGEANVEGKVEEILVCPTCGAEVRPIETPTGITYRCDSCRKFVTPKKRGEVPPEEVLKPADVEMTERVVEELAGKLRTVYGISKEKVVAIIDTIRGNSNIALNPMNLFMHIKQLEPRAHDYHLWIVINGLFQELRSAGWTGVVPPFQSIQQQMYQQQPWMYGGWQWQQPFQQPPFTFGYAPGYPPRRRTPSPPMKVVVEGQEVETDMAGYMAWRRWESDRKRDEEERREHELRMKKLEAEIKEIESRATGAGREGEEKIEVEVEGQKLKVPASLAPAYLALRGPKESEDTKKLRDDVSKLRDELHKKEIESLERQIGDIAKKLEDQPSFWEQLEGFERASDKLGYKRSGRTVLDILDSLGERVDTRAQQLIGKLGPGVGEEFRPEVRRTVEEREREAGRLEKRLERSKEVLEAEEDLLRAAAKVKV